MSDRQQAFLDAEMAITARLASYDPRKDRAAIAATNMAALVVRRLRTGETQTEICPGFVVVPEEPTDDLLAEFGKRRGWTLSYKCPVYADDEDEEQCWQVLEVRGGVNDREWYVLGKGETPADAIRAAIAAVKETTR